MNIVMNIASAPPSLDICLHCGARQPILIGDNVHMVDTCSNVQSQFTGVEPELEFNESGAIVGGYETRAEIAKPYNINSRLYA
jgi:hypothetical protein